MENVAGVLLVAVWIGWIVILITLYHKIFNVVYFSLMDGLLKELFVSALIGSVLTVLTVQFWWVVLILVVVAIAIKTKS